MSIFPFCLEVTQSFAQESLLGDGHGAISGVRGLILSQQHVTQTPYPLYYLQHRMPIFCAPERCAQKNGFAGRREINKSKDKVAEDNWGQIDLFSVLLSI